MISKKCIDSLPRSPGVYLFKDKLSNILYIGKAKSIKDRVRTYTYRKYKHSQKTRKLLRNTRNLDYIVCGSELEALLLESRLIKEYLPEFNIIQKRYRNFPFIKLTVNEDFPRVFVTWEIEIDGAKYLGPFSRRDRAEEIVKIIHKLFPIRECNGKVKIGGKRPPCLNYDLKKCSSPCLGKITSTEYKKMIKTIINLLTGHKNGIVSSMEADMRQAASDMNFEKAAIIRDQIKLIKEVIYRKQFQVNAVDNNNLIAIYPSKETGSAELFFIRKGGLADQKTLTFQNLSDDELSEIIKNDVERVFFPNVKDNKRSISRLEVDAMNIISRWLYRHRNEQSFVYIKTGRNKTDTIIKASNKVVSILRNLDLTVQ
ncbi:MAG: UvrB/UvrC motif-containing protein [bacterium]